MDLGAVEGALRRAGVIGDGDVEAVAARPSDPLPPVGAFDYVVFSPAPGSWEEIHRRAPSFARGALITAVDEGGSPESPLLRLRPLGEGWRALLAPTGNGAVMTTAPATLAELAGYVAAHGAPSPVAFPGFDKGVYAFLHRCDAPERAGRVRRPEGVDLLAHVLLRLLNCGPGGGAGGQGRVVAAAMPAVVRKWGLVDALRGALRRADSVPEWSPRRSGAEGLLVSAAMGSELMCLFGGGAPESSEAAYREAAKAVADSAVPFLLFLGAVGESPDGALDAASRLADEAGDPGWAAGARALLDDVRSGAGPAFEGEGCVDAFKVNLAIDRMLSERAAQKAAAAAASPPPGTVPCSAPDPLRRFRRVALKALSEPEAARRFTEAAPAIVSAVRRVIRKRKGELRPDTADALEAAVLNSTPSDAFAAPDLSRAFEAAAEGTVFGLLAATGNGRTFREALDELAERLARA